MDEAVLRAGTVFSHPEVSRAMLIVEYADGRHVSFTAEHPQDVAVKMDHDYSVLTPQGLFSDPDAIEGVGRMGTITGVTFKVKAGLGIPILMRNQDSE